MPRAAAENGARKNRALAASLKRIREARGFTQQQLGQRIGRSHAQIWRYERGLDEPGFEMLDRLLIALECWYGDLLADPALPPPPRRFMDRPTHDVNERAIEIVIDEFANPTRRPNQYPDQMRCWVCHGRPGECACYYICKVCGLPVLLGHQCSGILHVFLAGLIAHQLCCLMQCVLAA